VAGWSRNAAGASDILLVKWSSNGVFRWARRYNGPLHGDDAAVALGTDRNGNVTVAGYSQGAGGEDWVVISWSSAGTRRWVWRYGGNAGGADRPSDLVVDAGGRIYVTGWFTVPGVTRKARTVKLSPAGRKLWSRATFGSGGLAAEAKGIALRPGGGVYVVGRTQAAATGWDPLVARYSSSGSATLLLDGGIPGDEDLLDMAVTSNGTLAAVGSSIAGGNTQTFQLTYRSDGAVGLNIGGGAFNDAFVAVAADSFGGYYPVGYQATAADRAQWDIWRLGAVTGNARWHSPGGPVDGHGVAGGAEQERRARQVKPVGAVELRRGRARQRRALRRRSADRGVHVLTRICAAAVIRGGCGLSQTSRNDACIERPELVQSRHAEDYPEDPALDDRALLLIREAAGYLP
jgi:hypothetical protein